MATLASLKVLLWKLPALQTFRRFLHTSKLYGLSVRRSGRHDAFSISQPIPTMVCSPIIGGSLSRPTDRFSYTFGNTEFLRKHPYFLPCAISASFSAFLCIFAFVFLREVGCATPKFLLNVFNS